MEKISGGCKLNKRVVGDGVVLRRAMGSLQVVRALFGVVGKCLLSPPLEYTSLLRRRRLRRVGGIYFGQYLLRLERRGMTISKLTHFDIKIYIKMYSALTLTSKEHVFKDNDPSTNMEGVGVVAKGDSAEKSSVAASEGDRQRCGVYEGVEAVQGRQAARFNNPQASTDGIGESMMWETARS